MTSLVTESSGAPAPPDLPPFLTHSYMGDQTARSMAIGRSGLPVPAAASWRVESKEETASTPPKVFRQPLSPSNQPATYELTRVLGRGGMGEVWEAVQTSLGRLVAVKRIRYDVADDNYPMSEWEFRQEALVSARLEHPNIVPVHDLGLDEEGRPLLAMKLVRGERWNDLLDKDFRELAVHTLLGKHLPILLSVAQAVAFVHSRGIIHRDLKPSQVMVGAFGEVLLMDWGLAMVHDREALAHETGHKVQSSIPTTETATNPSGTVAFMAPEQTSFSAKEIGPWTDVYLLGGTLYYMLTGCLPHNAANPQQAFYKASMGEVQYPSKAAPGRELPVELCEIAMHAMKANILDRIPTAEEFIRRIQDYMTGATRRRESEELARVVERRLRENTGSYTDIAQTLDVLAKARDLWPENPMLPPYADAANAAYSRLAVSMGDLALARLQGNRIHETTLQTQVLSLVSEAEEQLAARERQRRMLRRSVVALMGIIVIGMTVFGLQMQAKNEQLAREKEQVELARRAAEDQRQVAVQRASSTLNLAEFMLGELRDELDMSLPRDRRIRDAVAVKINEHFDKLDTSKDSQEALLQLAEGMANIADSFCELALFDDAEKLAQRALTIRRSLVPADSPLIGKSLYNLAEIRLNLAQYAEAEKIYLESADLLDGDPAFSEDYGTCLNDLGILYTNLNDMDASKKYLTMSLDLMKERDPRDVVGETVIINNLALIEQARKNYPESAEMLQGALALLSATPNENLQQQALISNNLGQCYSEMGKLEEAEPLLRKAMELDTEVFGNDHPQVASSMSNLGMLLDYQGRLDEAEGLYRRAIEIEKKAYGEIHPLLAIRYNNLATTLENKKEYEESEQLYRKSLEILESVEGTDDVSIANGKINLALLLVKREKFADALENLRTGMAMLEKSPNGAKGYEHQYELIKKLEDRVAKGGNGS